MLLHSTALAVVRRPIQSMWWFDGRFDEGGQRVGAAVQWWPKSVDAAAVVVAVEVVAKWPWAAADLVDAAADSTKGALDPVARQCGGRGGGRIR